MVEAADLTAKPPQVSWEVAGSLYVAGSHRLRGGARGRAPAGRDGGRLRSGRRGRARWSSSSPGAPAPRVIGIAGPANHDWLRDHGVAPVAHGDGRRDRIARGAPDGIDAFIDTYGKATSRWLSSWASPRSRIDTIADFAAIGKFGVKGDGNAAAASAAVLAELADLVQTGELEVPIAATYPLARVREAYGELARRHTRGKIVLRP